MAEPLAITLCSNRGPVSFVEKNGGFELKGGAGGVAPTLDLVARRLGDRALWVAATTSDADRAAVRSGMTDRLREELGYRIRLLDIEAAQYSSYYDDVSNRLLWFANHGLWDEVPDVVGDYSTDAWHGAYLEVNRRFAQAAADESDPDASILFQDYHLSTAPAELRRMQPDRTLHHFTHSSFCDWDRGLGRLPREISGGVIEGMLGSDLIGMHVKRWTDNFLECCERVGKDVDRADGHVSHDGRRTWVRAYPIPIDAADLRERAQLEATQEWARRHIGWAAGRKLIARADRGEPSKNVVRGFEAFERLLDERDDLRDSICFVACVYPSRQSMEEYRIYSQLIQAAVARINERYPGSVLLYDDDDFDRSLGALLTYDVLLVNPIMDGMNLVSKEGPALNERDGVLVLSREAGSFEEMQEPAVLIEDPLDIGATKDALERALELPATERKDRAEEGRLIASARTPQDWIGAQLDDLASIRHEGRPVSPPP